jgi:hypothetical protein
MSSLGRAATRSRIWLNWLFVIDGTGAMVQPPKLRQQKRRRIMNTRTLLQELSLRRKLIYWIAGGFLLLFIALELKQSLCTSKDLNITEAANQEKA